MEAIHMTSYSSLLFKVGDRIAQITLNQPEAANSLDSTVSAELMDALVRCEEDPDVRPLCHSTSTARALYA
jgi:2-(1,2-epoxy-1,2-dihydrophenyl)acetyl-CoA isomerase